MNQGVQEAAGGGAAEAVEGGPPPKNIIVAEFPSMERLREWYASPEYAEALKHRRTALDRRLIFVTLTGKIIDIPSAEITGVREAKVFKTSVRGGRSHLIVQIPTVEIGFYVASNADWINAITSLRAK